MKLNQDSHDNEMKTLKQAKNDDITKYKELVIELEKTAEDLKASSEAALENEKIAMVSSSSLLILLIILNHHHHYYYYYYYYY